MSSGPPPISVEHETAQIRSMAGSLTRVSDIDGLVETVGNARFVCLGEASHGTHEFYRWPTWMWANREVVEFLTWLRAWNRRRSESERVGFYGLASTPCGTPCG